MRPIESINRVLVDKTNWQTLKDQILNIVSTTQLMGFDIETHDEDRHEGLNALMKIDDEGHRHGQKLIFDTNRTTVTGFSIYPDDTDTAYYFNLAQADVQRLVDKTGRGCKNQMGSILRKTNGRVPTSPFNSSQSSLGFRKCCFATNLLHNRRLLTCKLIKGINFGQCYRS